MIPESVWQRGERKRDAYAEGICDSAHDAYFGLSPKVLEQTLFGSYFHFLPSKAEAAAGERFVG